MKKMFLYVAVCVLLSTAFLLVYFAGEDLLTGTANEINSIVFYKGAEAKDVPGYRLLTLRPTLQAYVKKAKRLDAADYTLPLAAPYSLRIYFDDGTMDQLFYSDNHELLFRYIDDEQTMIMLVYDPDFTLLNQLLALFPEKTPVLQDKDNH